MVPATVIGALLSPLGLGVASAATFATDDLSGGSPTPTTLANTLAGEGVTVSNVTYVGADVAAGTFSGGTSIIGFDSGIVLSSGDIANIIGPNTNDAATAVNDTPGDADLDLLTTSSTLDAAVLEFDFVPDANTVFFSYVFGSEEYNEFVNSSFNDVFGFFVTAAGSTTKTNCAVVADGPDADSDPDPVTINTINNGDPFGTTPNSHPELYRNNDPDDPEATIDTGMDGLTVTLVCEATVIAGQVNHLKLAIADTADDILDSFVLLKTGSLSTTLPEDCTNGVDDDGDDLVDGADPDCAIVVPPTEETVTGAKYYDANANGERDPGEPGIQDWIISVENGGSTSVTTGADGGFTLDVDAGTFTVAEQQGGGSWIQTGNSVDQSGGTGDVTLNPDMTYTVELGAGETATGLNFGNLCLGGTGAHTIGFWQNKKGAAAFESGPGGAAGALALLNGLNLKNASGGDASFSSYADFRTWIRNADASQSAYMLSAQLAALALNHHVGLVDGGELILAAGAASANTAGFATVADIIAEADAALADPTPVRADQLLLSRIIDAANNDRTFVQAGPDDCPTPVFPV